MAQPETNQVSALMELIRGYQATQGISVAARLKVADFVSDEPVAAEDIAANVGVDPPSLYRLMRALATLGIFHEGEDRRFTATPMSLLLRSDNPASVRGWAEMVGREFHWNLWGHLIDSMKTGVDAPRQLYGQSVWEYRAGRPEETAIFSEAMAAISLPVAPAILRAYDFDRFERIVDIGGADGALLAAILKRYPRPTGIVFDLPHVVEGAASTIASEGLEARMATAGGSYFEAELIPDGADCYVLKSVLHDCPDDDCIRILQNVAKRMPPEGTLVVIEPIISPPNEGPSIAFSDINMLVATGGRERRRDEWEGLFSAAGFRLVGATPAGGRFTVIEGKPLQ